MSTEDQLDDSEDQRREYASDEEPVVTDVIPSAPTQGMVWINSATDAVWGAQVYDSGQWVPVEPELYDWGQGWIEILPEDIPDDEPEEPEHPAYPGGEAP